MKRVNEKVRDIVEVFPFTHLHDFAADPNLTLAGYHFTDITADLMAKWMDRVAGIRSEHGAALALAGFRGVGKSHFLSVLTALLTRPELRSQITDSHVAATAERLPRRHFSVASVRRGSGTSLIDEVKRAIAELIHVNPSTLDDSLNDLLMKGVEHAGDTPFVLLIDTALGRGARVARDDGPMLSEIADAAKSLGIFVGVALDDDISGADGPNSSIAASFTIDYLDQEHLYKIVDSHIFSKHQQMLPVLQGIYEYYREVLPGFRWSQQRFTSLYPLHPATVEIAPLIRLYVHDFALLGFASEAGVKIMGRPANSLIGLDEVYDGVEQKLRLAPELEAVFEVFDKVEQDVIAKMPVGVRLPSKLLLKGLLMLSLNGQGSSAAEIAASMMIFDTSSAIDVGDLLDAFVAAFPDSIARIEREGSERKYHFRLQGSTAAMDVLMEAAAKVAPKSVWEVLVQQAAEKFSDLDAAADIEAHPSACTIEWRGGIRRGEIVWAGESTPSASVDWSVQVSHDGRTGGDIVWQIAKLTPDEENTIRRYYALQTDAEVRHSYGEGFATAAHVESIAVEKIWQRVFLEDSHLVTDGADYEFPEEARGTHNLTQLFTIILAPVFEARYPEHPIFFESLGLKQVSALTENLLGGSDPNAAEVQGLAAAYAAPLGIVVLDGDKYIPAPADALLDLALVKSVLDGTTTGNDDITPLEEISAKLKAPPYGLTREAQHLMLATLVAQRLCEFVTAGGNRINHRSLDLSIIWDDIVGIASPLGQGYSSERMLSWARMITGNSAVKSLDSSEDRLTVIDTLSEWLTGWKLDRILAQFDDLPDENLNAAIWRTAANLRKSFGAMADTIKSLIDDEIPLDQAIYAIGEIFSDSEAEFERKRDELGQLSEFINGAERRTGILRYLAAAEVTSDEDVESARKLLIERIGNANIAEIQEPWTEFHALFATHYSEKHDDVMKTTASADKVKSIVTSGDWMLFEDYLRASLIDRPFAEQVRAMLREIRQMHCIANVEQTLDVMPHCSCSFSLAEYGRLRAMPEILKQMVSESLERAAKMLPDNISNGRLRRLSGTEIRTLSQTAGEFEYAVQG